MAGVLDADRVLFPTLEPLLRTPIPLAVCNALIKECIRRGFKGF